MAFVDNQPKEKEERQKIIINFIRTHPFCNVEGLVRGVENYVSRVTVFKLLHELIESGAVKRHLENDLKRNARDHKLVVDESNPLIFVRLELEKFEAAYFDLFKKGRDLKLERKLAAIGDVPKVAKVESEISKTLKDLSHKMDPKSIQKFERKFPEMMYKAYKAGVWQGRFAMHMWDIFHSMVDACLFRFLFVWSQKIPDQQVLQQLYSMIFWKIAVMHRRLAQIMKSEATPDLDSDMQRFIFKRFRESKGSKPILLYLESFKELGLEKEIEPVLDALWNILGDLQPYVYPEPRRYELPFKYGEDDWRKLASLLRRHEKPTSSRQDLDKYSQN